jgi:hypothetical protein
MMRKGTIVASTLIAAPPTTKNRARRLIPGCTRQRTPRGGWARAELPHRDRHGAGRGRTASADREHRLATSSGDMLLEALVACAGVTLNAIATAL